MHGFRFDRDINEGPVFKQLGPLSCTANISFRSKVPASAGVYAQAQAGALDFTAKLGAVYNNKVVQWNGLYNGMGGPWDGGTAPAVACDNFWQYSPVSDKAVEDEVLGDKGRSCQAFHEGLSCTVADWEGAFKDLFSPDDDCADAMRYIDADSSSALHVTHMGCNTSHGFRVDPSINGGPMITPSSAHSCTASISFASKVDSASPAYDAVQNGALNFTMKLGLIFSAKVIKWNGLYNGQGGAWNGATVPAEDCDNFWKATSYQLGL